MSTGPKKKRWITSKGRRCLFKEGRIGTGEDWAEKIACEICDLLSIPHAQYELARYSDRVGVLSYDVCVDGEILLLGNQLIGRAGSESDQLANEEIGFRRYENYDHNPYRILASVRRLISMDAVKQFYLYIFLDALIGNVDRHYQNWGVLRSRTGQFRLSPTFDHASSLGRELSDAKRISYLTTRDTRSDIDAYLRKGKSGICKKECLVSGILYRRRNFEYLHNIELLKILYNISKTNFIECQLRINALEMADVSRIFYLIPKEIISEAAINFGLEMIRRNKEKIISIGN